MWRTGLHSVRPKLRPRRFWDSTGVRAHQYGESYAAAGRALARTFVTEPPVWFEWHYTGGPTGALFWRDPRANVTVRRAADARTCRE